MDSNSCEKRLRNECIDRISDLPDSILGQILSYLPIKDIVATSILSTRWKTLFPLSIPLVKLELDDCFTVRRTQQNNSYFSDFVDKLLNVTLRDVPSVGKIVLNCEKEYSDEKIVSWVRASLRLNVEHLRVMSNLEDSEALLDTLNGCTTLVELELGNEFELCLPEEFVLPNLKRLKLYSLVLRDDMDSIHELIDGCPMLNEFTIMGCDLAVLDNLYVRHPLITKFSIDGSFNESGCRVVIDAPNLEAFVYEGHYVANYVMKNIKSLHLVCIDFDSFGEGSFAEDFASKALRLAKLVKGCSKTTRLCLSGKSAMALHRSGVPLPKFRNLTWLALGRMGSRGWKLIAQFLKNAPKLTTLTFEQELKFTGAYADFTSSLSSLPVCLKLRLKKIEIWEFKWSPDEIKLIEYFLNNARVLQELIVHCLPCENTTNLEKLSMLPRHSKACQVLFREKDDWGKSRYSRENWF